jgi:hypothetical protein
MNLHHMEKINYYTSRGENMLYYVCLQTSWNKTLSLTYQ